MIATKRVERYEDHVACFAARAAGEHEWCAKEGIGNAFPLSPAFKDEAQPFAGHSGEINRDLLPARCGGGRDGTLVERLVDAVADHPDAERCTCLCRAGIDFLQREAGREAGLGRNFDLCADPLQLGGEDPEALGEEAQLAVLVGRDSL